MDFIKSDDLCNYIISLKDVVYSQYHNNLVDIDYLRGVFIALQNIAIRYKLNVNFDDCEELKHH